MKKNQKKKSFIMMAEEQGYAMTWHSVLFVLKLFLVVRCVTTFVTSFMNDSGLYRNVDQLFYVLMTISLVLSLWKHDHKSGVVLYYVFLILEAVQTVLIYSVAMQGGLDIPELETKLFSLLMGNVIMAVPTDVYYAKRWKILL